MVPRGGVPGRSIPLDRRSSMPDSAAFEWTCNELEERCSLDRLEARGTVRLALKQAGLEARSVTPEQMKEGHDMYYRSRWYGRTDSGDYGTVPSIMGSR